MSDSLLSVQDLTVDFRIKRGVKGRAVRGVSFDIARGEKVAVVGESGSGKSVTAMAIMGILPPTAEVGGSIDFDGVDLLGLKPREMRSYRGRRVSMIFQDPMTAFNPVFTIGDQITEIMTVHGVDESDAATEAGNLLERVGVPEPGKRLNQYPHEYSGGMRQRAMVAMAIANKPDLLIADEPTTALDVTIQAQVLEVLTDVQDEVDAAILLITHDLGVVAGFADRVQVMYGGRIVERAKTHPLFANPRNPYTQGLLSSLPRLDGDRDDRLQPITGSPPSLLNVPRGCAFAPRCPHTTQECNEQPAKLEPVMPDHESRCHNTATLPAFVSSGDTGGMTTVAP